MARKQSKHKQLKNFRHKVIKEHKNRVHLDNELNSRKYLDLVKSAINTNNDYSSIIQQITEYVHNEEYKHLDNKHLKTINMHYAKATALRKHKKKLIDIQYMPVEHINLEHKQLEHIDDRLALRTYYLDMFNIDIDQLTTRWITDELVILKHRLNTEIIDYYFNDSQFMINYENATQYSSFNQPFIEKINDELLDIMDTITSAKATIELLLARINEAKKTVFYDSAQAYIAQANTRNNVTFYDEEPDLELFNK